jgi:hypothetical protein
MSYDLLDEMEHLAKKDLLDFLKTHNIKLPQSRQDKVLEAILKETGGHYEIKKFGQPGMGFVRRCEKWREKRG